MERHGFIHDMLDVKILILFIMNRVLYPVDAQKIYELAYQDDCLSYFDVCEAVPQMVKTGHLEQTEEQLYVITEKGRETCTATDDSLAYPVMQRAMAAVERFNREMRRDHYIHTEVIPRPDGDYSVVLGLDDEMGNLMTLELAAPPQRQGRILANAYRKKAEQLFHMIMTDLLDEVESTNHEEV